MMDKPQKKKKSTSKESGFGKDFLTRTPGFRLYHQFSTLFLLLLFVHVSSHARVIYVNQAASGAIEDGFSWQTAFRTISAGIEAGTSGDEIWVTAGHYQGGTVLSPGLALYGGFAGDETERPEGLRKAGQTRISGGGPVVVGATGCTLDGFHLSGGTGTEGGGLHLENADMVIRNCRFSSNHLQDSDHRYYEAGDHGGASAQARGAGIYASRSDLIIDSCTFDSNSINTKASVSVGFFWGSSCSAISSGAAIYCHSTLVLTNSIISNNQAKAEASGNSEIVGARAIAGVDCGDATISNCVFYGNNSEVLLDYYDLSNQILYGNSIGALSSGGCISHCTFKNNRGFSGNDIAGAAQVINSILLSCNAYMPILGSSVTPTYSCIAGGWPGEGDIDADPLLTDDFHLQYGSPCIDAGTDTGLPFNGTAPDMGAFEAPEGYEPGPLPPYPELEFTGREFLLYSSYWDQQIQAISIQKSATDFRMLDCVQDGKIEWNDVLDFKRQRRAKIRK